MSQIRFAKRSDKPAVPTATTKESSIGPPLLTFTPNNNHVLWRRLYLIRAKKEFGIVGDALAAKEMPDFDNILNELILTGTYTA